MQNIFTSSNKIRIGIDGRPLEGAKSGIGRYIFELCKELDKLLPEATFFIYSQTPVEMPCSNNRWVPRVDNTYYSRFLKGVLWLKLRCATLCQEDNLDWFWGSATLLPRLPSKIRTLVTVYDLNYKIVPDTMPTSLFWAHRLYFKGDVSKADVVTAISEGTSKRLTDILGIKVRAVVYPSVNSNFRSCDEPSVKYFLSKHKIQRPYILGVATMEPRKNLKLLIEVFNVMCAEGKLKDYALVLVGGSGWKELDLRRVYECNKKISFLGYVDDGDLPYLYTGADLFTFPSLYEGFGIPVLEARACGTPVVATDILEIREAGGSGNVLYVKPERDSLIKGIEAVISKKNKIESASNISGFDTWADGAKKLATLFSVR